MGRTRVENEKICRGALEYIKEYYEKEFPGYSSIKAKVRTKDGNFAADGYVEISFTSSKSKGSSKKSYKVMVEISADGSGLYLSTSQGNDFENVKISTVEDYLNRFPGDVEVMDIIAELAYVITSKIDDFLIEWF